MSITNNKVSDFPSQHQQVNEVLILCPSRRCPRCIKITAKTKLLFEEMELPANIEIITNLKHILKFHTWILPTVIINGKIASRGIYPRKEKILKLTGDGASV